MGTTRTRPRFAPPGRGAHTWTCRRCEAPTFVGVDAEYGGMNATVDNYPISNSGEIAALISGRMTYYLRWIAGRARYEIDRRDSFDIAARSADDVGANADERVVAQHKCGTPPVDRLAAFNRSHRFGQSGSRTTVNTPAAPPF